MRLSEGKSRSLFRRTYDFFLPAKVEPDTEIRIHDIYDIPADAIAEIPSDIELEQNESRTIYDLHDTLIEIHSR